MSLTSQHNLELPSNGLLRLPQVLRLIPVGKSTWWAGVASGRFPSSVKLGPKITCWRVKDIQEFLDAPCSYESLSGRKVP